jgi:hypothetical protein
MMCQEAIAAYFNIFMCIITDFPSNEVCARHGVRANNNQEWLIRNITERGNQIG